MGALRPHLHRHKVYGACGTDFLNLVKEFCVFVLKKIVQSFKNNILKKKILVCQTCFPQMIRDLDRWSF